MRSEERSILARIEADGVEVPRLTLGEEPAGPAVEALETGLLRETGRYDIVGEIARGGVGHILKGRDVDLGRDVALKVLREGHAANRELVQRLVEEAQVGGQLQHPGIVPVYELGVAGGGRPYFAMKLVKGETLASRLAARKGPRQDERPLLVLFEQVLSTMAYAHSRGVVHRDLKPSNIMIGSFGEVLVVDWGFAKVLARGGVADERRAQRQVTRIATMRSSGEGSESFAGSIMGTPAYMPPEQALGQTEDLDERSDVFALGAILTEILTGAPAYVGEPDELMVLAAHADLSDAYARLDACGADPTVVALARECLSPLRRDRPRDAGALAKAVGDHLVAVEERARRSRVAAVEAKESAARDQAEAAEAEARVEAERAKAVAARTKAVEAHRRTQEARAAREAAGRRRRQTLAIAAALLVAILVGAGGYGLLDHRRRAHERTVTRDVEARMRETMRLSEAGDVDGALVSAERAVEIARAGDAPPELLVRVDEAQAAARGAKETADRDAEMVERLELEFLSESADYDPAFQDYGIDLSKPDAGLAIRGSAIATELIAALHDAALRDESRREELTAIADFADGDAERKEIRQAWSKGHTRTLREMADRNVRRMPLRTVELLGVALLSAGERDLARQTLDTGWAYHPDSLRLNVRLARILKTYDLPYWDRVAGHYAAAWVLRPGSKALKAAREAAVRKARIKLD